VEFGNQPVAVINSIISRCPQALVRAIGALDVDSLSANEAPGIMHGAAALAVAGYVTGRAELGERAKKLALRWCVLSDAVVYGLQCPHRGCDLDASIALDVHRMNADGSQAQAR
jgi:hypothetical protein